MFFVVKRASLLIPSGPTHDPDRKHLFVCLTDPIGPNRDTLIVSISTLQPRLPHDSACRLFPGDHPFIKQESFVLYRAARVELAETIERGVKHRLFVPHEIVNTDVFARICKGLEESRFVRPEILDFYRRRGE